MLLGDGVGAFVEGVAAMAFDVLPADMRAVQCCQLLPQILVFYGGIVAGAPAVFLPAVDPACDAVDEVLTVGVHGDVLCSAGLLEAYNGSVQLHAIVGGGVDTSAEFADVGAIDHDGGPPSTPRVARTGSVSDNVNV